MKVAIVGGGATGLDAPYADRSWEIWGLHACRKGYHRVDRWFEIHPLSTLEPGERRDLLAGTYTAGSPVYTVRAYPRVPGSVRFPIERVAAGHLRVFTSSFAYGIALAVHEGATDIGLWGVELERGSARERTAERLGIAYWLGVATGRGIGVTVADKGLLRYPFYGLSYWPEVRAVRRELRDLQRVLRRGEFDGLPREYDEGRTKKC